MTKTLCKKIFKFLDQYFVIVDNTIKWKANGNPITRNTLVMNVMIELDSTYKTNKHFTPEVADEAISMWFKGGTPVSSKTETPKLFDGEYGKVVKIQVTLEMHVYDDEDDAGDNGLMIDDLCYDAVIDSIGDEERTELGEMVLNNLSTAKVITE